MPKEVIEDQFAYAVADGPPGTTTPPEMRLEISWQRHHMDVQIATVDNARDLDDRGFYVHLDRARVNRLIRALRRARDQAFGADA